MNKLIFCTAFLLFLYNSTFGQNPPDSLRWEGDVSAYEKQDSITGMVSAPILFTGSSSIRMWEDLPQRFPGKRVLNRGIGGSELSDLIYYADRLILKYKPRKIFIYCGGNDIWNGKSPERVLSDFRTLYAILKKKLPDTRIYYISIQSAPSRWEKNDAVIRANELIKAYLTYHTQDVFIDVSTLLYGQNGKPKEEFFIEDRLHLNSKGYDRWTRVIKYFVEQ